MVTGIGDGYLLQRLANDLSRAYAWNGPVCSLCGVGYLGSHACTGGITPSNLPLPSPAPVAACQHCWCGETIRNAKAHDECCMCHTRRIRS
jgi:hypothetical protein